MDPIADMFTQIRNAILVKKEKVKISPFSKFKFAILKVLEREKLIERVERRGKLPKRYLLVYLKYDEEGNPPFTHFKKISKPGQRIYLPAKKIKPVKSGYGIALISTSKGILTDREARKYNVGGEIIGEIW